MRTDQPYEIIDPPVTPLSPRAEIAAWIKDLEGREQTPQVTEALAEAREWLGWADGQSRG